MNRRSRRHRSSQVPSSWGRTIVLLAVAVVVYVAVDAARGMITSDSTPFIKPEAVPSASSLMEVGGSQPLNSQIVRYTDGQMLLSFNKTLRIPNWASWELTAGETHGSIPRGDFDRDDNIPACPYPSDYTGSGYDRGHMVPAADMKWSQKAMDDCFYMTNICPQVHALNGGAWKKLEEKSRLWAQADSAIIIVCGPVLTPRPSHYIGDDLDIAVPDRYFKVVLSPYANPPRAIGFVMPNARVVGGMQAAAVSVDSVEALTGLDFFAALPDEIENEVETQCRFHFWSTIRPK